MYLSHIALIFNLAAVFIGINARNTLNDLRMSWTMNVHAFNYRVNLFKDNPQIFYWCFYVLNLVKYGKINHNMYLLMLSLNNPYINF